MGKGDVRVERIEGREGKRGKNEGDTCMWESGELKK